MKLICLTAMFVNMTSVPFNQQDFSAIQTMERRCASMDEANRCLVQFQKREQGVYRGFCGNAQTFSKKALQEAELSVIMKEISGYSKETQREMLKEIGVE